MGMSMVEMNSYVELGNKETGYYVFEKRLHSVEIASSWKTLSDTCTLKLPNFGRDVDGKKLEKLIKVGDQVLIKLGYNDELNTEFEGYISEITPGSPLEIKCQDEMWSLKRNTIKKSWPSVTLRDVVKTIAPGAIIECPDMVFSPYSIDRISSYAALEKLKLEYGIVAYFRNKKMYVGMAYQERNMGEVNYHFQKNAIMGDLVFKRKEDVKVRLIAYSVQPNHVRIEVKLGDEDGAEITMPFLNATIQELRIMAKDIINKIKYDGYKGSFIGLGLPIPQHGMIANMMDDKYPEREGSFFIDGVKTTYNGDTGFKRSIELGRSANSPLIE